MQHCSAKATYNIKGKSDYSSSLYHYIQDSDQQKKSLAKKSELFENSNLDILDLPYGKLCTAQKNKNLTGVGPWQKRQRGETLFPKKTSKRIFLEPFLMCVKFIVAPPYPLLPTLLCTTPSNNLCYEKDPFSRRRRRKLRKERNPSLATSLSFHRREERRGQKGKLKKKLSVCSPSIDTHTHAFSPLKVRETNWRFLVNRHIDRILEEGKKPHMGRNKQKLEKKSRTATHNFPFTSRLNLQNAEFSFF